MTVEVDDEGAVVCGVEDSEVVILDDGAGAHVEPELAGCVDAAAESGPEPCCVLSADTSFSGFGSVAVSLVFCSLLKTGVSA